MCPLILGWGTTLSALYMREEGATEAHVAVGQAGRTFRALPHLLCQRFEIDPPLKRHLLLISTAHRT